jgi:Cu-Zn family superoxide dismutase
MRHTGLTSLVLALALAAGAPGQMSPRAAKSDIYNVQGEKIGAAAFIQVESGVRITLDVSKLPLGMHGIHIHAVGKCDPPSFTSAGAHFNPEGRKHGLKNPAGPHAGDMQQLSVGADGAAHAEFVDSLVSLAEVAPHSLFQAGGTAIVIHASPDDQMTDPSGNSGARIACGVITPRSPAP